MVFLGVSLELWLLIRWYSHKSVSVASIYLAFQLLTKVRRYALHELWPTTDWILLPPPPPSSSSLRKRMVDELSVIFNTVLMHTRTYVYIHTYACRRNRLHKYYLAPWAPRRSAELLFVSLELRSSSLRFCSSWHQCIRKFYPAMASCFWR